MNPFLSIYQSDTVQVFNLNQRGFFPFGIPTNADLVPEDERYPVIKLDTTYPGCIPNNQEPEMKFEIENDVPMPLRHNRSELAHTLRETMSLLAVGQSFFVTPDKFPVSRLISSVNYARTKLPPKVFVYRRAVCGPDGLRIWRLE